MHVEKYQVNLDIDFGNLTFSGVENIEIGGDSELLILNSVDLEILGIKVSGKEIPYRINRPDETIETDVKLEDNTLVEVRFRGTVSKNLTGMYVANYSDGYMITTQFESTGARRVFPCIDHPDRKAVFAVNVTVNDDLEAISNMPVERIDRLAGNRKTVRFQETPRMSTYLLYIGVGHFDSVERKIGKITGILSAPKGHLISTDFPLTEAEKIIRVYEEYFGIDYVLPKVHLISVPEFSAGAMENWGAITFREIVIMVNENTGTSTKQTVAEIIAHEIAHQWFGNLVTMEWWNDLWLNESFATFMAHRVIDALHPEWQMFGKFLLTETAGALSGDALRNSHPIDAEVKSPDDIAQIFDEISYGKGGSILRMIEGYVGEDRFRDGIRRYLSRYKFSNARGAYLWTSIEEVSDLPVSRVMESWIKQTGYPILEVRRTGGKLRVSQRRFLSNGETDSTTWPVPLTIVTTTGQRSVLMDKREIEVEAADFLKLNHDQTGFYRVLYDEESLDVIRKNLQKMSYLDKWGLVNDLFAFLKAGMINLPLYLDSLGGFHGEQNFIVAQEISSQLMTLAALLHENSDIHRIAVEFYRTQLTRLGQKKIGEPESSSILRGTVSANLAAIDDDYAEEIGSQFGGFFTADPDLRQAIAIGYARSGNDPGKLSEALENSTSDEDRIRIIYGLAWLRGENNFRSLMDMVKSGKIKKQDILRVYIYSSFNPEQRSRLFLETEDAVNRVEEIFEGTSYTGMMLETLIPLVGIGREHNMRELMEKIRRPSYSKGIDKGLELLEIYARLVRNS
ncbi:MAG: M1 family metallopeptidase [Candidatus Thermoplasmatota archaeon]|nr:M1 family metallopeptidase [Candidatus Thermoplasmatota archaeon]